MERTTDGTFTTALSSVALELSYELHFESIESNLLLKKSEVEKFISEESKMAATKTSNNKVIVPVINNNPEETMREASTVEDNDREIENDSNQLLNYTNIIKKNSLKIKKDIIEHLWKVIISDNTVDQYESNLVRRICGLIYFSDKESAEIKLKLINNK